MSHDDAPPTDFKVCVDCQRRSPPSAASYTLISPKFGWRLSRNVDPKGRVTMEWRCPDCWTVRKAKQRGP